MTTKYKQNDNTRKPNERGIFKAVHFKMMIFWSAISCNLVDTNMMSFSSQTSTNDDKMLVSTYQTT